MVRSTLLVLLGLIVAIFCASETQQLEEENFTILDLRGSSSTTSRESDEAQEELTDEFVIHLEVGVDPVQIAQEYNLDFKSCFRLSPQTCVFVQPSTQTTDEHPNILKLRGHTHVQWIERQVRRMLQKLNKRQDQYNLAQNPLYSDQWYLNNQFSRTRGEDINILPVWNQGYTGRGINIGIVDDGVEYKHPDFAASYIAASSWDFNDDDSNPSPGNVNDDHGTAVCGVAVAGNNNVCGVGVAFNANFSSLRLLSGKVSDKMIAAALIYSDEIDIYSNSWAHAVSFIPLSNILQWALTKGVTEGRGGKGFIYIWGAGNSRQQFGNANYDPFSSAPESISVAAVDHSGVFSWYSNPGSALLISAPSNGYVMGIATTDRQGNSGYSSTDCEDEFGGTSSACPLISGCVAVMLEANPQLGWRDVQHILAKTARKNDPGNTDWAVNGAGLNVNHNYGFGVIDTTAAVAAAKSWINVPERKMVGYTQSSLSSIPNDPTQSLVISFNVSDDLTVEHVQVPITLFHSNIPSLTIQITSPSGTTSRLMEINASPFLRGNSLKWSFLSTFHLGEKSKGKWDLMITDTSNDSYSGNVSYSELKLFGFSGSMVCMSVDLSSYCSNKSFKINWSPSIANTIVLKSVSNPKQAEIKQTVTGLTSATFRNLNFGDYQASLYPQRSLIAVEHFSLPDCSKANIVVQVLDCGKIKLMWSGAPKNTNIRLHELNGPTVNTALSNVASSGNQDIARPFSGRWMVSLSSTNGTILAQSTEFTGALCTVPHMEITSDQQCTSGQIIVKATETQVGMTLNVGPASSMSPVYSVVDSTTTSEALVLQFPRPEITGHWVAVVANGLSSLVTQYFSVLPCRPTPIVMYEIIGCDEKGDGTVNISWTGAPKGSWVGLDPRSLKPPRVGNYTRSESGSLSFKIGPGIYTAILKNARHTWIASSERFRLCKDRIDIQPPLIKVRHVQNTSFVLRFFPSDDNEVDFYRYRYSEDEKTWDPSYPISSGYVTFFLDPGTTYYIQAKASVGAHVWSTWSDTVAVTTKSR